MVGVIYKITNNLTGKCYIGSTLYEKKRITTHYRHLRENRHKNLLLQRDYNLYGKDSFDVEIIARDVPEDQMHIWEISEIAVANYDGAGTYNISRTPRFTPEQRDALSQNRAIQKELKNNGTFSASHKQ